MTKHCLIVVIAMVLVACSRAEHSPSDAGRDDASMDEAGGELGGVEGTVKSSDGVQIWYRKVGGSRAGAKTLLLMHGGPGLASNYLAGLEQLASPSRRVVRLDQRGVGGSSKPENDDYHMDRMLQDIDAVLSKLGVARFDFLGHSWGGLVGMHYAIRSPDRLDSLALISSVPPNSAATTNALAARVIALQNRGLIPRPVPDPIKEGCANFAAILPAYFADPEFEVPPELKDNPCDDTVAEHTWDQNTPAGGYDLTDQLGALAVPALVVMGELDFLADTAETTAAAFNPDAPIAMVPGAGHFPWMEAPEATLVVLRGFLGGTD